MCSTKTIKIIRRNKRYIYIYREREREGRQERNQGVLRGFAQQPAFAIESP